MGVQWTSLERSQRTALLPRLLFGTTLKKDDSGRFDCTIRMSDSIQLILRGTDAAVTWSSEDTSVVTVSADGKLKPVKAGTANVTASVGGATVRCVVRINN